MRAPKSILIIQTAFIGDVILATALIEQTHAAFPEATISVLVRKGNEVFFEHHPFVLNALVWDKRKNKYRGIWRLMREVRRANFDVVINVQRFAASGLITAMSGAPERIGFKSNPLSWLFSHRIPHGFQNGLHEVERNAQLLQVLAPHQTSMRPKLYPNAHHLAKVDPLLAKPFITISPQSVWFTKTAPQSFWIKIMRAHSDWRIYLIGAPEDKATCDVLIRDAEVLDAINLCGELSLMESAALMAQAKMNFTNDSAPMHLCSAVNAPVTAVYCSTVPAFGFGPLSDQSIILETKLPLACRPCGLHGYARCPKGHFDCGQLEVESVVMVK